MEEPDDPSEREPALRPLIHPEGRKRLRGLTGYRLVRELYVIAPIEAALSVLGLSALLGSFLLCLYVTFFMSASVQVDTVCGISYEHWLRYFLIAYALASGHLFMGVIYFHRVRFHVDLGVDRDLNLLFGYRIIRHFVPLKLAGGVALVIAMAFVLPISVAGCSIEVQQAHSITVAALVMATFEAATFLYAYLTAPPLPVAVELLQPPPHSAV